MAKKTVSQSKQPAPVAEHYDGEVEKRALRRYRYDCGQKTRPLGEVLNNMVCVTGYEDDSFDRRSLALVSTILDALDAASSDAHLPEGLLYSMHRLASGLAEIGARLEYAGKAIDNSEGCGIPGIDPLMAEVTP